MLKEMVEFSKELEKEGIYDILEKDEGSGEDYQLLCVNLHKNNEGVIGKHDIEIVSQKERAKKIFKMYEKYTRPFAKKNNKTLGGSTGLDTASFFAFRYQWTIPTNDNYKDFRDKVSAFGESFTQQVKDFESSLSKDIKSEKEEKERQLNTFKKGLTQSFLEENKEQYLEIISKKWKGTFTKKQLKKDLAKEYDNEIIKSLVSYQEENVEVLINDILSHIEFDKPFVVFFWINGFSSSEIEELLEYDKKKYVEKGKPFLNPKKIYNNQCAVCGSNEETVGMPSLFNNMNAKKPYNLHKNRANVENIVACIKCSEELALFKEKFLSYFKVFPLFISKSIRKKSVELLEKTEKNELKKLSFKKIIESIDSQTSQDELDYYLIIYDRGRNLISCDYITGFQFKKKNMSVFQLEHILNKDFFHSKLMKNYFSAEVKIKDANLFELCELIYRYRIRIFDYIYRAKYNSLDKKIVSDMFFISLRVDLKKFHDSKEKESKVKNSIINKISSFLKIDQFFGGDKMEKIEKIKKEGMVNDESSFAFFAGQIVKLLLKKRKGEQNTHSLVEPFINVTNLRTLYIRIEELFRSYAYNFYINDKKFNDSFKQFWSYLLDNKEKKFTEEMKIAFYAGYFDDDSLVYDKSKEQE